MTLLVLKQSTITSKLSVGELITRSWTLRLTLLFLDLIGSLETPGDISGEKMDSSALLVELTTLELKLNAPTLNLLKEEMHHGLFPLMP